MLSAALGFTAVLFGAFGAHGLRRWLAHAEHAAQREHWWATGAHYHLAHAIALGIAAYLATTDVRGRAVLFGGYAFVAGILLFSGSLYVMALTGARALGALTPLGGLCFLVGWAGIGIAAFSMR